MPVPVILVLVTVLGDIISSRISLTLCEEIVFNSVQVNKAKRVTWFTHVPGSIGIIIVFLEIIQEHVVQNIGVFVVTGHTARSTSFDTCQPTAVLEHVTLVLCLPVRESRARFYSSWLFVDDVFDAVAELHTF